MPRRTSHPVAFLLRTVGWSGSSEEMTTPVGDVLELGLAADEYDPAFETYGCTVIGATPGVGLNARYRIAFDADVLAYRIRSLGTVAIAGIGQGALTTVNLPETANPVVALGGVFSSKGRAVPFRVREDSLVIANPNVGIMFGGTILQDRGQLENFSPAIWADAKAARPEILNTIQNQALPFIMVLDIIRAGV